MYLCDNSMEKQRRYLLNRFQTSFFISFHSNYHSIIFIVLVIDIEDFPSLSFEEDSAVKQTQLTQK